MTMRKTIRSWAKQSMFGAYTMHLYHQIRALALSLMSDEQFAQRSYRKFSGHPLDLENPKTFDERQWWLKINYRDPLMTTCTDKVAVRKFVQDAGLGHLLHPLMGVYRTPAEIDWTALPKSFYLKTNHSSATNIRCDDRDTFDAQRASKLLRLYLRRNHAALSREWNYRGIEPRIMAEPIIETTDPRGLVDYRFFCSYGECKGIFVDVDTADAEGRHRGDAKRNVYDRDWNLLDVRVTRPRIGEDLPRPEQLYEMVGYAEKLSREFPFCRVDLYNPEPGRVVFGEITFFHAGGNNRMDPAEYQARLGTWVNLSRVSSHFFLEETE